ncbi:LTA synthase family protein [Thiocapsa bogorovii]|uniref:LTA synthase family protein n=1 Tax=Thiocapsa bogorovii TaxID=521689 RepID=UPI001E3FF044|nr:LTA synthase family protein [Thiocapsa bogorovii]UHD14463.1 LTA synthase family protein [Thiocapsa bogorovii]
METPSRAFLRSWQALSLAFCTFLLGAFVARAWLLQDLAGQFMNCRLCILPGVVKADAPFLTVLAWIFLIALARATIWWSLPLRALAVAGLLIYLADLTVMSQFFTRLTVPDLRIYLAQPEIVLRHLTAFSLHQLIVGILILVSLATLTFRRLATRPSRRHLQIWTISILVLISLNEFAIPAPNLVHEWAIRNVLLVNQSSGVSRDYSDDTRQRQHEIAMAAAQNQRCREGRHRRDTIVILILESWSTYHSAYWSGFNDWTPRLDELAKTGLNFSRFHAGGPNTNEGLIAILTGRDFSLPISRPHEVQPFETAWGLIETLPRQIGKQGYHTAFLTSANLAFTRKGEWLRDIGFEYVEGHEYSGYAGIPRHHFDSVPDARLLRRARDYIAQSRDNQRPLFLVIETVSSHHPFVHPDTRERSEEAVFRYVDASAATFIDDLRAGGFFDDGVLIVTSDHRAMTILPAREQHAFGRSAASLIPMFILTGAATGERIDDLFHQADIMPTLLAHVSAEICHEGPARDLLAPLLHPGLTEPRCVFHARGDRRDQVDVLCEDGSGTVRVNGDASQFIQVEGIEPPAQDALLDAIARERIRASAGLNPSSTSRSH